jgi:hypothetical protein
MNDAILSQLQVGVFLIVTGGLFRRARGRSKALALVRRHFVPVISI